jgi:predicted GIY-YIG superfamily endonuclease
MSYVYLLLATPLRDATYVGATVDLDRRLRQHNKEIKGGAHATGAKVAKGHTWIRAAHVAGFPDWQAALQFEWRWKQLTRKLSPQLKPIERRIIALKQLLTLDRPTTKAKLYTEWESPPNVVLEDEESRMLFEKYGNIIESTI